MLMASSIAQTQSSKLNSNPRCEPVEKETVLNFLWIDATNNNDIIVDKIIERNICSKEEAQTYLREYHKFLYCLG